VKAIFIVGLDETMESFIVKHLLI